jgi:hypothetical protein
VRQLRWRKRVPVSMGRASTACLLAGALALGGTAFLVDAGAATSSPRCAPKLGAARTLAATSRGRIVVKTGGVQKNIMFACLYSRGFWINVGMGTYRDARSSVRVSVPRLVGSRLAYIQAASYRRAGTAVRVFDLRRVPRRYAVATDDAVYGEAGVLMTGTDLELKPNGSVAWIWTGMRNGERLTEVHKFDAGGHVLLDSGADVQPGSLSLSGSTLYWTRAAGPFSATLE